MAKLFIANCSKQHHEFAFVMPEGSPGIKYMTIPVGAQVQIPGDDLSQGAIDAIISQHAVYGLIDARRIHDMKRFVGLCYSIGRPVDFDLIEHTVNENDDKLNEQASRRREQQTVAIAEKNRQLAQEVGAELGRTEVETIEENSKDPGTIAEGYEVTEEGRKPRRAEGAKLTRG